MIRWKPRTFRSKLVLLITLTCAVSVALTVAALIWLDFRRTLGMARAELASDAHVLAMNSAPALMFDDPDSAAEMLAAFRADPAVAGAYIFKRDGSVFASYRRADLELPPMNPVPPADQLPGHLLIYDEPITHERERLGSLVLIMDLSATYESFLKKALTAATISGVIVLLALLASARVERTLTRPVAELAAVAERVSTTQDYSLRVKDPGDDEIGRFGKTFNQMLARIEEQEQEVRNSERLYRAIGESIDYGVWVCAPDGRNIYASDSLLRLVGMTQEQCSGVGWSQALHPDDRDKVMRAWQECVRTLGDWDMEVRFRGADGQYHPVLSRGVLVRDEQGEPIYWAGINLDISTLKRAEESLRQLNETLEQRVAERTAEAEERAVQLRALAAELTRAEDHARRRLAQALHDDLQQVLFAAKMRVSMAQSQAPNANVRAVFNQVTDLLAKSIDISRSLTVELSPPILYDAGLAAALHWLARHMHDKHNLIVHVDADPDTAPLGDEMQAFLFHAARELLFNTVKHAGVLEAWVRLEMEGDMVSLAIEDHGRGMDPQALRRQAGGGFGLFSIRERLRHFGGECTITTAPGAGTTVRLLAPPRSTDATPSPHAASETTPGEPRARPVRVMIADDHQIVRDGLVGLLQSHPQIEVVAQAADGHEALDLARKYRPDVIVMDVSMPRLNGVSATQTIRQQLPGTRVIALSMYSAADFSRPMLEAGADVYLSKTGPADELIKQILHAGQAV